MLALLVRYVCILYSSGNDEDLTMWEAHLEQLGEFGSALMKKVSDMVPEPGDNKVWRIVAKKAKEGKEEFSSLLKPK